MIQAGQLRHQISIEVREKTSDSEYGGNEYTWTEFAAVRARVLPSDSKETDGTATVNKRYQIRFLSGLLQSMRVVDGGQVYEITSVLDVRGMGRVHDIKAQSFVGA
jgi:head-tail adaptor